MLGLRSPILTAFAVVIVVVLTTLFVSAGNAFAAPPSGGDGADDERKMQAQALFDQGQKLADSDPKGALAAFRLAYDIRPDFRVQYNIGRLCVRLKDSACAKTAFELYLKEGGDQISAKRKKEVEAELKSLGGTPGTALIIKSSVAGAFIKVDGVVVGKTPLDKPVSVTAGSHKVVLVADGNVVEKTVKVASGAQETVEIDPKKAAMEPEPGPAPAPAAAPAEKPAEKPTTPAEKPAAADANTAPAGPRKFPVVPWVVTGVLAAGTAVTGVLTLLANSEYNDLRNQYPISRDELNSVHERGNSMLLATGVLGAATLISGSIAAYFTLVKPSAAPAPQESNKTVGKVGQIGIGLMPGGIAIVGRMP
jgi:hypothetical protein